MSRLSGVLALLVLGSSAVSSQSRKPGTPNLPVGYDRTSSQQPAGAPADARVLPDPSASVGVGGTPPRASTPSRPCRTPAGR